MNKNVNKSLKFSLIGTNSAGLKAKMDSLQHVLQILNYPSCVTIQETKMSCPGKIKIEGYEIFEKIAQTKLPRSRLVYSNSPDFFENYILIYHEKFMPFLTRICIT